ncbi:MULTISPECIES: phage tail protein [Acinetobacter]|uniref:phage tail protein n=1 Tax=Acinetobacter TaxID=469 RepID=UPI0002CD8F52|nr:MULTISPECIES: phage tail protein [Acinetobacter]ENW90561.1 hypothetical protein F905_00584 [Acinetobacter sp. CIP 53.82]MBA0154522.1 hypothetical protein [Acinetobacter indicus]
MHVILFLLAMFVPAVCFSQTLDIEKYEIRQEKAIIPLLIGAALVAVAVGIYTFLQMRKMQKKNQPKPNQLDGTIADEGTSFCDIAGSPHVHANITDIWGKSTQAIKKKSGGFLGVGKTSQVTGYRYYAKFAAFIGNRIEKFLGINFDNRKWILHDPKYYGPNFLQIYEPNLFGENEGGVAGVIDIHTGLPEPEPNPTYQQYFPLVSGYPYQSYLVFRGFSDPIDGQAYAAPAKSSFYLGNSGYMKEMLLWVKRIRVKNDGGKQWYDEKSEVGSGIQRYFPSDVYQPFQPTMAGTCSWIDPSGKHTVPWDAGTFPFIEVGQSYSYTYDYEKMEIVHQYKFPRSPGASDPSVVHMVSKYGMTMINEPFTKVAPLEWIGGTPKSDVMWGGAVIRSFKYSGLFFWGGGIFDAKLITTPGAKVEITTEDNTPIIAPFFTEQVDRVTASLYQQDLPKGIYKISVTIDGRYPSFENDYPPRPYAQMVLRGKTFTETEYEDINPIHKIREILTDDTAMGKPELDINDVNFIKAADRIWGEGLGISWAIDEKSCIDAIEELCYHIEAGVRVNRQSGLYEVVLFRDDWFEENEIHDIAENKIKDLSLEVMNSDDIVNQLNVTYYDRQRIKNSTFSVYENGSILTMGHANAESIDFPYFMNMRNAEIVANWKLKQYSTPAWKGTFTTGWREARKWNRYDLVKITWSKKWQGTILARIMKIDLGNGLNNEVMIDFEEVVPYSGEMNTSIVVDDSTEEKAEPAKPAIGETFEAPYYIAVQNIGQRKLDEELAYNQDVGFTFSTYRRPQWNALYAEITTANVDKPEDGWIVDGNAEFVTSGQFDQLVSRTTTQIPVKNLQIEGSLNQGDLIVVGSWIIGNVGQYEFMIIESFDTETSILTVKRGALDTIPFEWGVDTNFWLSNPENGLFSLTEYLAGQNVKASALTVTPSSKLEQLGSTPVYMRSRAIRPYPPANVKINGMFMPLYIEGGVQITWANRNRLQQTGGEMIGYFEGSVVLEPNTQTLLTIIGYDADGVVLSTQNANVTAVNTYTLPASSMDPNTRKINIVLRTVRDGYECLYPFTHDVLVSNLTAPQNVTFEVIEL